MITKWVLRLIVANLVMFFISMASPKIMEAFTLVSALSLLRPWTLVTYMFLHGGFEHIFFNMLALFFFGPRLEIELGGKHFLWLYAVSGIMAALMSFVFMPYTPIIGASGAVYGVMLGFAFFWPREPLYIWGMIPVQSRLMVIFMTLFSLYSGYRGAADGIAHFAHLGGFLGGFLYLKWLNQKPYHVVQQSQPAVAEISKSEIERWSKIDKEKLHVVNREELDRILNKINTAGVGVLSSTEREFLNRFSQL